MNNVIKLDTQLPTKTEDLKKFVLIAREKLVSVKAEIRVIDKLGLANDVKEQKKEEAQWLAELLIDAEVKIGEITSKIKYRKNFHGNQYKSTNECGQVAQDKLDQLKKIGLNRSTNFNLEKLAKNPEIVEKAKQEAREKGEVVNRTQIIKKIDEEKKEKDLAEKKQQIIEQTKKDTECNPPQIYNESYETWLDKMNKCDLLLTDPPYSTDIDNIIEFVDSWLFKALNKVKKNGAAYIFIGAYPGEIKAYLNAKIPEHIKLEQILVWEYKNTLGNNPKDRYKLNYQNILFYKGINNNYFDCHILNEQWAVQSINAPDGRLGNRYHSWQKPIELAERLIRHSTKENNIILDPFVCTGTFVIAANKLKRNGFGCDISKENLEIAIKRGCKLIE